MAQDDDPNKLRLQQYKPQQPNVDLGVNPLPQGPTQQNTLADQMAALITNMQQSPGGGTVTVNQPSAIQTVQNMQAGQSASQALQPTRVPPRTTTAPINTLDQNVQPGTSAPAPQDDLAATIAKALAPDQGGGLKAAAEAIRSPADAAAYGQLEQAKVQQAAMQGQATEDVTNQSKRAGQRVAQEFPGQTPGMFPEGLSKTLEGGRTFKALPSGGYASTQSAAGRDAEVAARRANYQQNVAGTSAGRETAQRSDLFSRLTPATQGIATSNMNRGGAGLTTDQMLGMIGPTVRKAQSAIAPARTATLVPSGRGYRPAGQPQRGTDAMNNPNVLRAVVANNRYDAAVRRRAQQRLSQMQ
jgi:hypothetical protein